MNELDPIHTFRAEIPEPSAGATARARRAWQPGGGAPRRRRPAVLARLAVGACLVAAATAAAVIIPAGDDGRLGAPDARAAQTLRHAAAAQAGGLTRPLGPGEYWYVRKREAWSGTVGDGPGYTYIEPTVREDWFSIDGYRGFRTRSAGEPRFLGPRDRARWEAAGRPDIFTNDDGRMFGHRPRPDRPAAERPFFVASENFSYRELLAFPRDPDALYRRIRSLVEGCDGCGHSVEDETFTTIADLLRDAPIPNDFRAALLRSAALIPGITFVERERDVAGRTGVGVASDAAGTRHVLIFNRDTYELLGENERVLKRDDYEDAAPGQLRGGSAYIESGVVDSPQATP